MMETRKSELCGMRWYTAIPKKNYKWSQEKNHRDHRESKEKNHTITGQSPRLMSNEKWRKQKGKILCCRKNLGNLFGTM